MRGAWDLLRGGWTTTVENADLLRLWLAATLAVLAAAYLTGVLDPGGEATAPATVLGPSRLGGAVAADSPLTTLLMRLGALGTALSASLLVVATALRRQAEPGAPLAWDVLRARSDLLWTFFLAAGAMEIVFLGLEEAIVTDRVGAPFLALLSLALGLLWALATALVVPAIARGAGLQRGVAAALRVVWTLVKLELWIILLVILPLGFLAALLGVGAPGAGASVPWTFLLLVVGPVAVANLCALFAHSALFEEADRGPLPPLMGPPAEGPDLAAPR